MQGGWGGMSGGAWGGAKAPLVDDEEDGHPPGPLQNKPPPPPLSAAAAFTSAPSGGAYPGAFSGSGGIAPAVTSQGASTSAGPSATNGTLTEAELWKKEAELKKKEAELRKLEAELVASGAVIRKKNFPICFPLWHHDIQGEIPEASRRVVKELYFSWWGLVWCLSWQGFCASVMLGYKAEDKVPSWFLALIYWITGVPLSMYLWYRRIYNAAKEDSKFGQVFFFFFFACHVAFCIWCAIAIPFTTARWSFCGFGSALDAFNKNNFLGTIYIIGASFWVIESLWCLWCLKDAYLFYRAGGFTSAKETATQAAALAAFQQMAGGGSNRV